MRERIEQAIRSHPLLAPILDEAASREEPVYLVGGALRDLALGIEPKDLDFATATPFDMAQEFAERFGSRVVALGKEATSTYRIPLDGFSLDWVGLAGGTIDDDLRRRDFTVNAIAYDPDRDRFLDPLGGFADLKSHAIRMASPGAFAQDPARIVKAYRMLAQLPGFHLEEGTEESLRDQRDMLMDVVPERLHAELERLFQAREPGPAVRRMAASGVLFSLFPELKALEGLGQNAYHHADVLEHTLLALDACDGEPAWLTGLGLPPFPAPRMELLRLSCLLHDMGKADTRTVDAQGRVHFFGHSKPSAERARAILKRLKYGNAATEAVADLCLNHLRPLAQIKTHPRHTAIRRLIHTMGERLDLLLALAYADKSAARGEELEENLRDLRTYTAEVLAVAAKEGAEIKRLPKLVSGLEAMEILGLQRPGPGLGLALDALMERQVDGAIATREQAVAFLKEWRKGHLR
jgi:putative nucleotidyltransferase with HDIG domain